MSRFLYAFATRVVFLGFAISGNLCVDVYVIDATFLAFRGGYLHSGSAWYRRRVLRRIHSRNVSFALFGVYGHSIKRHQNCRLYQYGLGRVSLRRVFRRYLYAYLIGYYSGQVCCVRGHHASVRLRATCSSGSTTTPATLCGMTFFKDRSKNCGVVSLTQCASGITNRFISLGLHATIFAIGRLCGMLYRRVTRSRFNHLFSFI